MFILMVSLKSLNCVLDSIFNQRLWMTQGNVAIEKKLSSFLIFHGDY